MTLVGWLPEHSPHPLTTSSNTTATAPPTCANTATTHLGQPACRGPPVPGRHLGGAKKKLVFRTPLLHRVRWDAAWGAGCGRAPARPSKKNLILVRRFCRRRFCRRRRRERTLALAFFWADGKSWDRTAAFFQSSTPRFSLCATGDRSGGRGRKFCVHDPGCGCGCWKVQVVQK